MTFPATALNPWPDLISGRGVRFSYSALEMVAIFSWLNTDLTMPSEKKIYYVYAFLRSKDSERGPKYSPYYIGKGCGQRAFGKKRSIPGPKNKSFIVFLEEGLTEKRGFCS